MRKVKFLVKAKLVLATLAVAVIGVGTGVQHAEAGTTPPQPPSSQTHLECQYEVYQGQLWVDAYQVGNVNGTTYAWPDKVVGRMFSTLVTNNAHTKSLEYHVRATTEWTHSVYRTYSYGNVKAWVSGVRCETV